MLEAQEHAVTSGSSPRRYGALLTSARNSRHPNYGTYHHSTPKSSEKLRTIIGREFRKAFAALPFPSNEEIRILDVGCGLGFISCVCAEFYTRAHVTGVDTFTHASLKGSSLAKARENARILGFSRRVHFEKGGILHSDYSKKRFDLFVSNLVFHNLGKRRFEAYDRLSSWMSPSSRFLLGDLFFYKKASMKYLSTIYRIEKEIKPEAGSSSYEILIMSKAS
jgi:SAM-dependent methyltransferase